MDQLPPDVDEEKNELELIKKAFSDAPRFTRWRELYLDAENAQGLNTFKNKQLSAIYAYDLNPNDSRDRQYASELGYKNTRKCQNWAREYYEATGVTQEKVFDILASKATSTNNAKYLQMLMEIIEIYNPKPSVVVQNNTQNNIQVSEAEQKDFSEAFKRFLEQE